jgi:hypothetical protein
MAVEQDLGGEGRMAADLEGHVPPLLVEDVEAVAG